MRDEEIYKLFQQKNVQEVLDILQEEAAEVIQAVSKIRRFGWNNKHHNK